MSIDTRPTPTFSIVMPAYNTARWISTAIESVLAQTRGDFELIVVDDGSSDDTGARVEPYLRDVRLTLISQPNLGQSRAQNAGVEVARGTYVSLLDSDDFWFPNYLEVTAATLDCNPLADVAYTDAWILDDGLRRIARRTVMSGLHPPSAPRDPELFLRALLELGNFVVSATVRRSTLAAVGPYRVLEGAEDYELCLRIAANGHAFVRSPETLAIIRRRPGQVSAQGERMRSGLNEVFRIVAEEYDIPDDIRALAREQIPIARFFRRQRPRRVPRLLRGPYHALSRAKWYYFRPPREVRTAFPNLKELA